MEKQATIVVGVDGSECSRTALRYALEEAARRGAAVRVVWAMRPPQYWATPYGPPPVLLPLDELTEDLERAAWQMVDDLRTQDGAPAAVPVTVQALIGDPANVLVDQARDADLLVVGHRGRGAVASGLLGSVGLACALHATVPVTIVRPIERPVVAEEAAATAAARA